MLISLIAGTAENQRSGRAERFDRGKSVSVELNVFINPQQGASYDEIATAAIAAEELGFDGFFRSDHYLAMGGVPGLPGPTDAWVTLAGLARETRRMRLGTLMTAATFRLPGPLAISVAQVDQMSAGRIEFGFGTGGFAPDHTAYGIPLPDLGSRFERFEEQLAIITGLWDTPAGELFSYKGHHYELADSPALPKPAQSPRPPIIIGGRGPRRTPRLAARYAAEYNYDFPAMAEVAPQRARLDAACEAIGRDPASLRRSAIMLLVCARDPGQVAHRADAGGLDVSTMLEHGLAGSPGQIAERIGLLAEAGISRLYLQTPRQLDVDHFADFMQSVVPQLSSPSVG
jgi:F420-dependent oxidoreductase-like protein